MTEDTDSTLIGLALKYWANHIETGNMTLSAQDAEQQGKQFEAFGLE